MRTDDLIGTEFDWVAIDHAGHIGIFSTAGYGPVPGIVLTQTENHEALIDWIGDHAALPSFADLVTFAGDVPIYVFDWAPHSGPYRRVQKPHGLRPITIHDLPERLRAVLVELDLNFHDLELIDGHAIESLGERASASVGDKPSI